MNTKKRIVTSIHNLPPELQEALKQKYPYGYSDRMIRIEKGPGDFFCAVVLETEDINYLIKVDVKVDGKIEEEEDKGYYDDDIKGADEIADSDSEEEADDRNDE